jgi:hypothetical protein
MRKMTISSERRRLFNGTVLLGHMAARKLEYDVLLPGSQANLDAILSWLMTRDLVEISEQNFYEVSTLGFATFAAFQKRYRRVLQYFDVFSAVDLSSGDFALAHYEEFKTEADWRRFLNDDRWEDLRVPVAGYLGADPIELVFAHFMQEGRFSFEEGAVMAEVVEQGFLLVRELSDRDPELMCHLARWAPSREAPEWALDHSSQPFWKTRWNLDVAS